MRPHTVIVAPVGRPVLTFRRSGGIPQGPRLEHAHRERLRDPVLTADPEAPVWAEQLRRTVLRAAAENPVSAAQAVIGEALGDAKWESFPAELKELFTASSPAVLAESPARWALPILT